jgi:acyl-coenzyme A synthetase/AMP-(fatty) acid ligase
MQDDLVRFARARHKAPEEIVFLDEMPLNATGKVDRVTLKKMAQEGTAAASGGQAQPSPPFREDRRR